ncbi:MAG: hypothetical protein GWN32_18120, partial [Gemmatimonadetes bacterium]|nr:hypothetical protein [Gemmatimonadota bacterium]
MTLAALAISGVFDRPETIIEQVPATGAPPAQIIVDGTAATEAAAVAQKVRPSIVAIEVGRANGPDGFDPFASGSGVVLSDTGYIVTNAHVIADGEATRVVLQDGSIY